MEGSFEAVNRRVAECAFAQASLPIFLLPKEM
jgi:hypothetical protein